MSSDWGDDYKVTMEQIRVAIIEKEASRKAEEDKSTATVNQVARLANDIEVLKISNTSLEAKYTAVDEELGRVRQELRDRFDAIGIHLAEMGSLTNRGQKRGPHSENNSSAESLRGNIVSKKARTSASHADELEASHIEPFSEGEEGSHGNDLIVPPGRMYIGDRIAKPSSTAHKALRGCKLPEWIKLLIQTVDCQREFNTRTESIDYNMEISTQCYLSKHEPSEYPEGQRIRKTHAKHRPEEFQRLWLDPTVECPECAWKRANPGAHKSPICFYFTNLCNITILPPARAVYPAPEGSFMRAYMDQDVSDVAMEGGEQNVEQQAAGGMEHQAAAMVENDQSDFDDDTGLTGFDDDDENNSGLVDEVSTVPTGLMEIGAPPKKKHFTKTKEFKNCLLPAWVKIMIHTKDYDFKNKDRPNERKINLAKNNETLTECYSSKNHEASGWPERRRIDALAFPLRAAERRLLWTNKAFECPECAWRRQNGKATLCFYFTSMSEIMILPAAPNQHPEEGEGA